MFNILSINQKNLHESMSKLIYKFLIITLFFLKTSMVLAKNENETYVMGFGSCITEKRQQPIWEAIKNENIDINDITRILRCAKFLRKTDINSQHLFSSDIDKIAYKISKEKYLRDELRTYQRKFPEKYARSKKFVIVEGRDIGTEIFPEAKFKIFLWADAKIRAKRRYEQIIKKGE